MLVYLDIAASQGNLCPSTPNHRQRYTESHPKCETPHFTSNETLIKCKNHMTVDLYLFYCIWGTGASQENFPQVPKIMNFDIQKVIQSVKTHILHQLKPYSSEKCHPRVEFCLF